MNIKNPKVDFFLSKSKKWQEELELLRMIILDCGLIEEMKWGKPCYILENSNIVIIQPFKEYFALGFFKGSLLNDNKKILTAPGMNSQAMRQIRFTNLEEALKMKTVLKAYIYKAIKIEKAGLRVNYKETSTFKIPAEFQKQLDDIPALKTAFDSLTPGRRRAYIIYLSQPKQAKTRESRIEKHKQKILIGKGLND